MKLSVVRAPCLLGLMGVGSLAQEVIPLHTGLPPGSVEATYEEKLYFSETWNTDVVSNVTEPALIVYRPAESVRNGHAVVICPGGGFLALSIASEGIEVAKWLAARGITAFVLKYRLVRTGDDATQEFAALVSDRAKFKEVTASVIPLSIADGLAAVMYVRQHASEWSISAERVGIIGFSAGGTVAAAVGMRYTPEGRPALVALIYAAAATLKDTPVPADAPPIFLAAATDDQLGLAPDSIDLYKHWTAAHRSAELHMYSEGGHGFGMRKQGLPSDRWIDRFGEWLELQGWMNQYQAVSSAPLEVDLEGQLDLA